MYSICCSRSFFLGLNLYFGQPLESTSIDGSLAYDVLMNSPWWNNSKEIITMYYKILSRSMSFTISFEELATKLNSKFESCLVDGMPSRTHRAMVQVRRGRWQNGEVLSWLDAPRWAGQVNECCTKHAFWDRKLMKLMIVHCSYQFFLKIAGGFVKNSLYRSSITDLNLHESWWLQIYIYIYARGLRFTEGSLSRIVWMVKNCYFAVAKREFLKKSFST